MYSIKYHKAAVKDIENLKAAGLDKKARSLIDILKTNPYQPPYEKLVGNLQGFYSRRISLQHRLIYTINDDAQIVEIYRMCTHYA